MTHEEAEHIAPSGFTACRDVPASLIEDLYTQWMPDAVGGCGTAPFVDGIAVPTQDDLWSMKLRVPYGSRWKDVPVIDTAWQAHVHGVSMRCLPPLERRLSTSVFGYRDATTPYREEYDRLREKLSQLGEQFSLVYKTDVSGMFESVRSEQLVALRVIPSRLGDELKRLESVTGMALLPGHRWARRVANLHLAALDSQIDVDFCRWQDDYYLFGQSNESLMEASGRLRAGAESLGLQLNESKSQLGPPSILLSPRTRPYPHSIDEILELIHLGGDSDSSAIRYGLRRLAEERVRLSEDEILRLSRIEHLLPRLTMYLASLDGHDFVRRVATSLSLEARSDWALARALALLRTLGIAPGSSATSLASRVGSHPLRPVRELAFGLVPGGPAPSQVSDRVRRAVSCGLGVPLLQTNL